MKLSTRFRLGLRFLKAGLKEFNKDNYYLVVLPSNTSSEELRSVRAEFPDDMKVVVMAASSTTIVEISD